jgi:hypothetical protein
MHVDGGKKRQRCYSDLVPRRLFNPSVEGADRIRRSVLRGVEDVEAIEGGPGP